MAVAGGYGQPNLDGATQDLSIGCSPVSAHMPITRHAAEKACQEASTLAFIGRRNIGHFK